MGPAASGSVKCETHTFCCVSACAQLGDAMCHMPVSAARQAATAAAGERDDDAVVPLPGVGPAASGSSRNALVAGRMRGAAVWKLLLQAVAAVLSDLGPRMSCCAITPATRARGGEAADQASPNEEAMAAAERRMSSWDIIGCCRVQTRPLSQ